MLNTLQILSRTFFYKDTDNTIVTNLKKYFLQYKVNPLKKAEINPISNNTGTSYDFKTIYFHFLTTSIFHSSNHKFVF